MILDYLLFFLFALACEILGTLGGFGSSVLFVPLAGFFLPRPMVLALTSILHVFSNSMKLGMFWKSINWKLFLLFGIPGLLFTIAGAFLAGSVDIKIAGWILGFFLLGFSVLMLIFPKINFLPTNFNSVWSGSVAGFAAGFLGTGGAIRGMALVAFNLEKSVFVATSASIDFGVDLSRFFIYASEGFMQGLDWIYVLLLFLASWLGTWIGKIWLNKIEQDTFRKIVIGIIFITAVATLIHTMQ
jgi:uncharacterized membrane protein YfcA